MREFRYNTEQTVVVGPFLDKTTNKSPITTITLAGLTYKHWICSNWSIINLNTSGRIWIPTGGANGFYLTMLTALETVFLGHGSLYYYNPSTMSSPVVIECQVLSQGMWDVKYGSSLFNVELIAQKG